MRKESGVVHFGLIFVVIFIVIAVFCGLSLLSTPSQKNVASIDDVQQLDNKIKSLEGKVKVLELEVALLKSAHK